MFSHYCCHFNQQSTFYLIDGNVVYLQEFEIDKSLGIKGPADVAKMGIAAYNNECRKIVMRYASEWQNIVTRIGRWIGE